MNSADDHSDDMRAEYMDDNEIASGLQCLPPARDFHRLFPNAEHAIVEAQRDFDPDGWKPVREWISRSHLHDRYVIWLVVAVETAAEGTLRELEKPSLYAVEVEKVEKGRDERDGPLWEFGCWQFEEGDWQQLVASGGDFAAVGLEMRTDAPVDRFAAFWRDTRPNRKPAPLGGVALRAPLRFSS